MKKTFYATAAAWGFVCLAACTQEEFNTEATDVEQSTRPAVSLTVTTNTETRTVLTDLGTGKGLEGIWQTTDEVGVWNVSESLNSYQSVKPMEEAKMTDFKGTVNCLDGDRLAFFYPKASPNIGADPASKGMINVDFTTQQGTLESIANSLDLIYGAATVSVDEGSATAKLGVMKAAHTVWNVQFYDETADNLLDVEKMYVRIIDKNSGTRNEKLQGVLNLFTQEFTTKEDAGKDGFITVKPDVPTKNVYFVTPPNLENIYFDIQVVDTYGMSHQYNMYKDGSAENGNKQGLYMKSVKPGKIYRFTAKKTSPGDYIEFGETKWATGNLMWNNGTNNGTEQIWKTIYGRTYSLDNYFIAPSQEWSPEQICNSMFNSFGSWPEASPTPNASVNDLYFSLFICGCVGKYGWQSAWGGNVQKTGGTYNITSTNIYSLMLGIIGLDFRQKLYSYTNQWISSFSEVTLEQALSGINSDKAPVTGTYKGDLSYFATKGKYALPSYPSMADLLGDNGKYYRKWAVIWVNTAASSACSKHNFPFVSGMAPIFGVFISKKPLTGYAADATYKYAIRLEKADMRKGIFLPAEGYQKYTNGRTNQNNEAGSTCNYLTGIINEGGSSNGLGSTISYGNAKYVNNTFSHGAYQNGGRDGRFAIRPVYIGD